VSLEALLNANFKTEPWNHQLCEFERSADAIQRALFWSMRTGKTKFILDTISHLARKGEINCAMIFAPKGVHLNWLLREAPLHMWEDVPFTAIPWDITVASTNAGSSKIAEARKAAWWAALKEAIKDTSKLLLLSFNNESVTRDDARKIIAAVVKRRTCMGVWDECADYRTPGAKRTKMMRAVAKHVKYRRILDGTPATNSPLHLFSQFELLGPSTLGFSRTEDFNKEFAVYEKKPFWRKSNKRTPKVLMGYQNLDKLTQFIAPFVSKVSREDCTDLPPIISRVECIEYTAEQREALAHMKRRALEEIAGEKLHLSRQVSIITKLQQIGSGFVYDNDKKAHWLPGGNPRLDKMAELATQSPGKCIIWCQFQPDLDAVMDRLRREGRKPVEYHGRIDQKVKEASLKAFQEDESITDIVGQVQSLGRGREASAAHTIIWYSHTFNALLREQANERATKMGGRAITSWDIVGPGVDEYILDAVNRKINVADEVAGQGLTKVLACIQTNGGRS
jgi:hypothetical protein